MSETKAETVVQKIKIHCTLNRQHRTFEVFPMARLLDILREDASLTGTKEGCGEGECGACSVFMNGQLVNSCLVPAIQVDGAKILTIEGIAEGDKLHRIQQIFLREGGAQCGMCTPGMILAVIHLLRQHPNPTEEQIRIGLAGNLCRCTGYMKIFEAAAKACKETDIVAGIVT